MNAEALEMLTEYLNARDGGYPSDVFGDPTLLSALVDHYVNTAGDPREVKP